MKKPDKPTDPPIRKSVALPASLWAQIEDFRFTQRITTEAAAIRQLIADALKRKGKKS